MAGDHSSKTREEKNIQEEFEASCISNSNFGDYSAEYSRSPLSLRKSSDDNIDIWSSGIEENEIRDDKQLESNCFFDEESWI